MSTATFTTSSVVTHRIRHIVGTLLDPFSGPLPRDLEQYFNELQGKYQLIVETSSPLLSVPPVIKQIFQKPNGKVTWDELYTLERAYVAVLPDAEVRGALTAWRVRLYQIIGDASYQEYLKSKPVDASDATVSATELRAALGTVVDRVHYLNCAVPGKERIRNRLSFWMAAITAVIVIFIGYHVYRIVAQTSAGDQFVGSHTLLLVGVAGLLGGFISVQQRLQAKSDADPLFKRLELSSGFWNVVLVSPITGAVFALLLYVILTSGILSGPFLPVIYAGAQTSGGMGSKQMMDLRTFFGTMGPTTGKDFALLIVWSFIAGFAERFVPDVLTRLSAQNYVGTAKS